VYSSLPAINRWIYRYYPDSHSSDEKILLSDEIQSEILDHILKRRQTEKSIQQIPATDVEPYAEVSSTKEILFEILRRIENLESKQNLGWVWNSWLVFRDT